MKLPDLIRYSLFAGVAITADANRRHYHMTTTWAPHLAMNSFSLLLPDLLRLIESDETPSRHAAPIEAALKTFRVLVCDNASYAAYVAPLAIGYLLSHPDFNIYKGEWGELELAGFGLDAIPHAATAFALAALSSDTAQEAARQFANGSALSQLLRWCAEHPALFSGAVLALATLVWEVGEYRIHHHELAQRGDISKINMQWSLHDTLSDCAANMLGWAAAVAWKAQKGRDRHALPVQGAYPA